MKAFLAALAFTAAPLAAHAEILGSAPGGFVVRESVTSALAPSAAFKRFTNIAAWWSSDHTFSGSAKNLHLDARAGGCWCETLANGGVRHMEVIYVEPGKALRLTGGLGPLQSMAVVGTMDVTFAPAGVGTKVTMTYSAAGYTLDGLDKIAPAVDRVLGEQMASFAKAP